MTVLLLPQEFQFEMSVQSGNSGWLTMFLVVLTMFYHIIYRLQYLAADGAEMRGEWYTALIGRSAEQRAVKLCDQFLTKPVCGHAYGNTAIGSLY
jgi:hypothetical protein